jgi:hypothetical protein
MKVTMRTFLPFQEHDAMCLVVDGVVVFSGGSGEAEDYSLGRDLKDLLKIPEWLRAAYEAGKRGEPFEYERTECTSLEEVDE